MIVRELGLDYEVRPSLGKDAGLFTDMRQNRAWLAPHWKGTRVLNLFAHTGAFSVSARAHGAAEVVSVDLSEAYLARMRRNFELNELDAGELYAEDVFKTLDRLRRQGRKFERVVVDPPGYSHSEAGVWQGERSGRGCRPPACACSNPAAGSSRQATSARSPPNTSALRSRRAPTAPSAGSG